MKNSNIKAYIKEIFLESCWVCLGLQKTLFWFLCRLPRDFFFSPTGKKLLYFVLKLCSTIFLFHWLRKQNLVILSSESIPIHTHWTQSTFCKYSSCSSTGCVVAIVLLLWAFVILQNIRIAEFVIAAIGIKAYYRENLRVEDKEMSAFPMPQVSAPCIFFRIRC